ncbi:MAG: glycosyltransferase [Eubacteriales bacterium]|nr:glycosyltransferase [Eubacteriales bacterium]
MKIMQVIPYFCFGGAEIMCENLTYALNNAGQEVFVVSLYNERTPIARRMEEAGIRIVYLDKKLGLDLSMVPKLTKLMKQERPDVVHTHLDVIKYAAAAAKLAGVKKCVHTVHSLADREAEGRIQKIINDTYFRKNWSVPVALTPEVQASVSDFYVLPLGNVPVIYNGIDLSRCIPKTSYETGNTVTILHVGRFDIPKNHAGLLEAFRLLRETHPECRLRLVGDGDLRSDMEALAQEKGIADAVEFCGMQSNVYPYLHDADIFTLPSIYEGNPMTIIEAMGTGLPIVASRVGGIPDMISDGESGLLVEPEPEVVCDALARMVEDKALRQKLGQAAKMQSQTFSADQMARDYISCYSK